MAYNEDTRFDLPKYGLHFMVLVQNILHMALGPMYKLNKIVSDTRRTTEYTLHKALY